MLNGLDLFSGIGGISEALSPWCRTLAYCERERFAQAVLLSRMARGEIDHAPIWDDVTTLKADQLPPIDIISGGFPCQDISVAGKGAGLGGERSGLFYEICRLAGELRPSFIFLENVSAITIRGGAAVIGALTALGYDARWITLSAADVGATHKRERWWCLAYRNEQRRDEAGRQSPESRRRYPLRGGEGRSLAHGEEQRIGSRGIERDLCEAERRPERGMLQRSDEPSEGILEDARHGSRRPIGRAGQGRNPPAQRGGDHDEAGRPGAGAGLANANTGGRRSGGKPESESRNFIQEGIDLADTAKPGFQKWSATRPQGHTTPRGGGYGLGNAEGNDQRPGLCAGWPGRDARLGSRRLDNAGLPPRPPKPGDPAWAEILQAAPDLRPAIEVPWYVESKTAQKILKEPKTESSIRRMAAWVCHRNNRIRALGNSVDVVCAREAFKILTGLT